MTIDVGTLIVGETIPSGNVTSDPSMADWLWFQPSTETWHKYNTSTSSWDEVDVAEHGHPTLEDINFLGAISVNGVEGVSGRFSNITRLDIVNGIVVGVEVE